MIRCGYGGRLGVKSTENREVGDISQQFSESTWYPPILYRRGSKQVICAK